MAQSINAMNLIREFLVVVLRLCSDNAIKAFTLLVALSLRAHAASDKGHGTQIEA